MKKLKVFSKQDLFVYDKLERAIGKGIASGFYDEVEQRGEYIFKYKGVSAMNKAKAKLRQVKAKLGITYVLSICAALLVCGNVSASESVESVIHSITQQKTVNIARGMPSPAPTPRPIAPPPRPVRR